MIPYAPKHRQSLTRGRRGEQTVETPAALVEQAGRIRGWSLTSHHSTTDGRYVHTELRFENRKGLTSPTVQQFHDAPGLSVRGATTSVLQGVATVWVTCVMEEGEGDG